MGGHQIIGKNIVPTNTNIYVTITDDRDKLFGPWPLDLIDRYNFEDGKWEELRPPDFQFGSSYNYSNLFHTNPEVRNGIRLRIWREVKRENLQIGSWQYIGANTKLWYHFDWPDDNTNVESDWWLAYNQERKYHLGEISKEEGGVKFEHTIYAVVWKDSVSNKPVIQYWFFYPYNDFVNDHEGDWEHINVIISSQIPDEASIESVQYYFHEKWTEKSKDFLHYADKATKNHPWFI